MRIGITCYPTYGGSGAVATELGLELARRGHDVHFIAYASPFRLRGVVERVTFHEVAARSRRPASGSTAPTTVADVMPARAGRCSVCPALPSPMTAIRKCELSGV